MKDNRFYTPDGFVDLTPEVCAFKKECENKLHHLFSMHGYQEIETPGFEYCDVYTSPDFVEETELYKVCDQKGRLLCARYDGTIPAARFASTILKDEKAPLRLSYIENMYRFNQAGGGKQNGFTQAGIELLGAAGSASDSEVIALAIESALSTGVKDLQITIGQVKFFDGLMKQMGIDEENAKAIRSALEKKDFVTIENIANAIGLSEADKDTILLLPQSQGGMELLEDFGKKITGSEAADALNNLREILEILDDYGYSKYVTVDLGLLGSVGYYTGLIFKGHTYEVGFPIISGGRYDNTVGEFGRDMEAVGFSLSLQLTITALMRQGMKFSKAAPDAIIGYDESINGARLAAVTLAEKMRSEGNSVILDTSSMTEEELNIYADEKGIETVLYMDNGEVNN